PGGRTGGHPHEAPRPGPHAGPAGGVLPGRPGAGKRVDPMNHPPDCQVICGPTAAGKTAPAVGLAQMWNGEVVSADSMQVYRGMDIGTAKPTAEEMQGVPHHMLDVADPWENFSVGRYVAQAIPVMDDILARGKLPIVAGGTGLYIDHLMAGRE